VEEPLKYELEVQEGGRIELNVPLLQGTQVTVFVTQEPVDDLYDLMLASEVSLDLWDEEDWDEEDWDEEEEGERMPRLVTDPREVGRLAEKREDENWAFRDWIRTEFDFDDERLMSVVRQLADEITAQIDCTRCANCCRETDTELDDADIERLAAALGMTIPAFQQAYLECDEDSGGRWLLPAPCPLLDGNLCRVYEVRPQQCREYPHLYNDFRSHSISRIHNTFLCPIVFNVVEEMKYALCWPRRDRWRR
jgi:Fe-S-cluster containining protein